VFGGKAGGAPKRADDVEVRSPANVPGNDMPTWPYTRSYAVRTNGVNFPKQFRSSARRRSIGAPALAAVAFRLNGRPSAAAIVRVVRKDRGRRRKTAMRERHLRVRWTRRLGALAWTASIGLGMSGISGCAVSDSDVHRWETTENGPEKLYAIVTHDKYAWPLREEAALSLIRMRPRNGKRVGLEALVIGYDTPQGRVQGALSVLPEDARRRIVNDLSPKLVEAMRQPPPPKAAEGSAIPTDASVPYKDAAFALLSHEPPLATDEKAKADLTGALTQWVQTDFEDRIDNSSQQFGVEQIMRFVGAPSVKALPAVIGETSSKVDRACALLADIGDEETKKRASEALVGLAKRIDSTQWIDKQRPLVIEANKKQKVDATPKQVSDQLAQYQESELEKVFTDMKRVGGRPAVDFCLAFAHDKEKSERMRTDALAALENRIDKNFASDVNVVFDIIRDDTNPDKVRAVALARLGELPKEMFVPKLYSLFDKKWQVRLDAARLVLKTISTKDVPDFLHRLPGNDKTKMALSEPIAYGALILAMDPGNGPKPRDVLNTFLQSGELGAKLTAAGSYYGAKRADAGPVGALAEDKSQVPKCDPADQCGWQCDVPKSPGSQERETKTVTTVGEFVRWCIEPSLQ
jgi:hypothetical protein